MSCSIVTSRDEVMQVRIASNIKGIPLRSEKRRTFAFVQFLLCSLSTHSCGLCHFVGNRHRISNDLRRNVRSTTKPLYGYIVRLRTPANFWLLWRPIEIARTGPLAIGQMAEMRIVEPILHLFRWTFDRWPSCPYQFRYSLPSSPGRSRDLTKRDVKLYWFRFIVSCASSKMNQWSAGPTIQGKLV